MVLQQLLLRLPAFTRAMDFPPNWPLSGEELLKREAQRLALYGEPKMDMMAGLKGARPFFERMSLLADGDVRGAFRKVPKQVYLNLSGLVDPGAPLPPPPPPPPQQLPQQQARGVTGTGGPTAGTGAAPAAEQARASVLLANKPSAASKARK